MKNFEHPKVFGLVTRFPRKKENLLLAKRMNLYFKKHKVNAIYIILETAKNDLSKLKKATKLMDIAGIDIAKEFQ